MAKQLNAEQKTISDIFIKANFLIPDYQRPYSWIAEKQCETLWDDVCDFAFPFDHPFDSNNDTYFLGTILTYKNSSYQSEIIDGQQRLITFLLMLRAFYAEFEKIDVKNKENILSSIGQCIWNADEFKNVDKTSLKLKSEVASEDDLDEFRKILKTGEETRGNKSNYSQNYRLFKNRIKKFKEEKPDSFEYLPMRILNNCILLPIEVDSQNTALRIFMTLNDRGLPLTYSDIFRAQLYKFFSRNDKQAKESFVKRWKELEKLCRKFSPKSKAPINDLFMRHYYYAKTKKAVERDERISETFGKMFEFYAEDNYKLLCDEKTFEDLETLAKFWNDVITRNERFSQRILKRLFVLKHSPYTIWSYVVSLYFMSNRKLDEEKFCAFLDKTIAMILMNAILDLGKQNIRRPFLLEFKNIFYGEPLKFDRQFKRDEKFFRGRLAEMKFSNSKPITRMILAWWTFSDSAQALPPLNIELHQEHIYAKNRHENFEPLKNPELLETLGNKSLLEKSINIAAADYRFEDKKKYYLGWQPKDKKYQPATFNLELRNLAETKDDFTEEDIVDRNEKIFDAFVEYLRGNDLLI